MTGPREEQKTTDGTAEVSRDVIASPPLAPLFSDEENGRFRKRWESIQVGFVDEPRRAVAQAGHPIDEVMTRLNETFTSERGMPERQRDHDKDVSTEDLRQGFQRYRAFFDGLLSI